MPGSHKNSNCVCVVEANVASVPPNEYAVFKDGFNKQNLEIKQVALRITLDEMAGRSCKADSSKVSHEESESGPSEEEKSAQKREARARIEGFTTNMVRDGGGFVFDEISITQLWTRVVDRMKKEEFENAVLSMMNQYKDTCDASSAADDYNKKLASDESQRVTKVLDVYQSYFSKHYSMVSVSDDENVLRRKVNADKSQLQNALTSLREDILGIQHVRIWNNDVALQKMNKPALEKAIQEFNEFFDSENSLLTDPTFDRYKQEHQALTILNRGLIGLSSGEEGLPEGQMLRAHKKLDINDLSMMLSAIYLGVPLVTTNVAMVYQINKLVMTCTLARRCLVLSPTAPLPDIGALIEDGRYALFGAVQKPEDNKHNTCSPDRKARESREETKLPSYLTPPRELRGGGASGQKSTSIKDDSRGKDKSTPEGLRCAADRHTPPKRGSVKTLSFLLPPPGEEGGQSSSPGGSDPDSSPGGSDPDSSPGRSSPPLKP